MSGEVRVSECFMVNTNLIYFIFFQASIFQEFRIEEDSVIFLINLTVLLDCLTIFSASSLPGK